MFNFNKDNKTYVCNIQRQVKARDLAVIVADDNQPELKRVDTDYNYLIDDKPIVGKVITVYQRL